mgnify:FL=1
MDKNNSNKIAVIISIITIIATVIFGLIYSNNKNKDKTYNDFNEYFHDYKINEVQRIHVSLEEVANKYLADTVSEIVYNPRDVFDKLDETTKEKYASYSDFEHMLSRIKTVKFLNARVKNYSSGVIDGKRAIYVIDDDDNKFVFIENSINNYLIKIN